MTTMVETKTYASELRSQLTSKHGLRLNSYGKTVDQLVERIQKDGLAYAMAWGGYFTDALKGELTDQARKYIEEELASQDDNEMIRLLDIMVIHGSHFGIYQGMGIPQRPMDMMVQMVRDEVIGEVKRHLIQSAEFALAGMVRERFTGEDKKVQTLALDLQELHQKYDRARSDTTKEKLLDEIDTATMKYNSACAFLKGLINAYVKDLERHQNLPKILNPDAALSYHLQQI